MLERIVQNSFVRAGVSLLTLGMVSCADTPAEPLPSCRDDRILLIYNDGSKGCGTCAAGEKAVPAYEKGFFQCVNNGSDAGGSVDGDVDLAKEVDGGASDAFQGSDSGGIQGKKPFIAFISKSVTSEISEIWTADADGSNPQKLISKAGYWHGSPSISADGSRVAFERGKEGSGDVEVIVVHTLETGQEVELPKVGLPINGQLYESPAFALDGSDRIVLSFSNLKNRGLAIYENGAYTPVTTNEFTTQTNGGMRNPCFSYDGLFVAFSYEYQIEGQKMTSHSLRRIDLKTGDMHEIHKNSYWAITPSFSPDGTELVAKLNPEGGDPKLYQVEVATGNVLAEIGPQGKFNHFPFWARDGSIVFSSGSTYKMQGDTEIWYIAPNSTTAVQLTDRPDTKDFDPVLWVPQ